MNVEPIIAMIPAGLFKRVEGVDELAKLAQRPTAAFPACFVIPDAETAVPPIEGSYVLDQTINSTVAIVIATHPDQARRGAAGVALDALEEAVLAATFGRQPEGWSSVLTIVDVRTAAISAAMVARVIRLRGRRHRRTQISP